MTETPFTEDSLFLQALEIESPEEQATFLNRACGDNAKLRSSVEELFRHHRAASGFLESPPTQVVAAADAITAHNPDHGLPALHFLEPAAAAGLLGRLGHYEIEKVVGAGGFGVVLKARDTKLDRIVAVKTLAPSLASSASARQRFVREAKAAAAVKHDNVVGIHAVSDEGPVPYLVMEFVSGVSLEEKLQQAGMLDLPAILRFGSQIASGLAAAHKQGLVHRDVKPANILLENSVERVKITDFGLARAANDSTITREGEVAGTPQFMSPEQALSQPLDSRSDLFSLGSVLYAACTGRSPFRAASAVAALRRVCDDTPRPIREINPEIPDWLVAIISRLLAKNPDERFQTAAEVSDLLGQHLAELQHPDLAAKVKSRLESKIQIRGTHPTGSSIIRGRWLFAAAAAFVLVLLSVSLTEAIGVTHLAGFAIRIVTGEGTLVVESDDPAVKVTIEGDGGLSITGAGPQEVRLRPGSYRLRADKDGKPARPDRELVSITRGDKQIVRVRLEGESSTAAKPAAAVLPQPFAILSGRGATERKFATLAEALLKSSDGDTIEIRGNGPFLTEPIQLASRRVIRAGEGFHPVITMEPATSDRAQILLTTNAPLVLEGLEFHGTAKPTVLEIAISSTGAPLYVANSRFTSCEVMIQRTPSCQLRNSQFSETRYYAVQCSEGSAVVLENNILASGGAIVSPLALLSPENVRRMEITRNVFTSSSATAGSASPGKAGIYLSLRSPRSTQTTGPSPLRFSQNILSGMRSILYCNHSSMQGESTQSSLAAAEYELLLRERISWHDEQNLYPTGTMLLSLSQTFGPKTKTVGPTQSLKTLAEWNQLWGQSNTGSIQGAVRFQGGDAVYSTPHKVSADDFRLRSDSAGYRAGPGGKDLGPDLDLVGPGAAYERWKKSPEYQKWLKDTGQLVAETPPSAAGAFVILSRGPTAERKCDTLAEAVEKSSNGDTIAIRANGPFVTPQLSIATALTIRAGAGYCPVIKAARDVESARPSHFVVAREPLTLEGLEFQGPVSGGPECAFIVQDAPCYVANCRFSRCVLSVTRAPCYQVRNSHFSTTGSTALIVSNAVPGLTQVVDNNLLTTSLSASGPGTRIDIRRNLVVGPQFSMAVAAANPSRDQLPVGLHTSQNIFVGSPVLRFSEAAAGPLRTTAASGAELEAVLRTGINWRDDRNLYSEGAQFLELRCATRRTSNGGFVFTSVEPTRQYGTLSEWNEFWGQSNTGSIQGTVRFQGGDGVYSTPHTLGPDDFRLLSDSAGYRAGPNGKDLGPDIDIVGPGAAYELWKKTAEYEQWLKETEQVKS